MNQIIKTTCPYCGVGCGISATVNEHSHQIIIQGDKSHPANFGRLCSKGSALDETIGFEGRLLQPKIHNQDCSWDTALDFVANSLLATIKQYGADAVAFYGSGQLLTEDYYVANKLMKGFIGSANMDTNSRLCMSSSVAGHKRAFGSDTVPGCYEDFELADLILLIGSNTAWCHPVIFQRIRAAKADNPNLKIVVIDPRKTNTCDIADLHLPLASGSDAMLFGGLLHHLHSRDAIDKEYVNKHTEGFNDALAMASIGASTIAQVADYCQLSIADVQRFYDWFVSHKKVMSLYSQGINQSSTGTDKVNAIINCHLATGSIGKPGMGPFSLTGQPNAMGGREVGGLAHQLAAHMDFAKADDIARVARFWGSEAIASKPGYPAVELFDAIYEGKVKAVWIMGTNPVVSMPNADKIKQALQKCGLVIVSDCMANTDTTALSHVLLPAQGWSEKDGTVTNSERRISRQRALFKPAGNAKPDWWILTEVAKRMGFEKAFPYQTSADIFREHAALSGFENNHSHGLRDFDISSFANISQAEYEQLEPIQWPVNTEHPKGRARLFDDGFYFTESGKAQFIAITPKTPFNLPDKDYPLILNTGRLRDQWHTMTRTGLAAKLNQHKPEPFVEVHPQDAKSYNLQNDSVAFIKSAWGSMLARIHITDCQLPGNLFVPMHWTEQLAKQGRMGTIVNPVVDSISKQPESKHTPVLIRPYQPAWQGFILSRNELAMKEPEYWIKIKGEGYYRYELAGKTLAKTQPDWVKQILQINHEQGSWQEYQDSGLNEYRAASIINAQLDSVVFIATQSKLPERNWLTSLFKKNQLEPEERKALLSGLSPLGIEDTGTMVCACFNVGEKTIKTAIKEQGLKTFREVSQCLKAGSNCGSCIPEIKALL